MQTLLESLTFQMVTLDQNVTSSLHISLICTQLFTLQTRASKFMHSEVLFKKSMLRPVLFLVFIYLENDGKTKKCHMKACKRVNVSSLKKCQVLGPPISYDLPAHPFFLTASRDVVTRKISCFIYTCFVYLASF